MKKFQLRASDRRVSFQFSVSNRSLIPGSIRAWNEFRGRAVKETDARAFVRKQNLNGVQVLEDAQEVYVHETLITNLERHGFRLSGVVYSERQGGQARNQTYYMVRFVFFREGFADQIPGFEDHREEFACVLRKLMKEAFWKVRGYQNPMHDDRDNELPNLPAISLNFEARMARLGPDGKPEMRWQRDQQGDRIGDTKVPWQPDPKFILGIRPGGDEIELFPYVKK